MPCLPLSLSLSHFKTLSPSLCLQPLENSAYLTFLLRTPASSVFPVGGKAVSVKRRLPKQLLSQPEVTRLRVLVRTTAQPTFQPVAVHKTLHGGKRIVRFESHRPELTSSRQPLGLTRPPG